MRPDHTALIMIDIQNDYACPVGPVMEGDLSMVEAMREPTVRVLEAARRIGVPVIYTQAQNDADHDTARSSPAVPASV